MRAGRKPNGGGASGEAKRIERMERRKAQEEAEREQEEAGLSMWELKYTFQQPVGDIRIVEDWSGEGNGIAGLQWLGGVFLSRYMDSRQIFPEDYFEGLRVIEVGAGCGLTSIYAALRGANVVITDMDTEKCLENVDINLGARGLASQVSVRRLEWATSDLFKFDSPYDLVLAGDCLYEEACIAPLLETMWALAGPETEILLCGVVGHNILASFLEQVDRYFYRQLVDTSTVDTLASLVAPTSLPSLSLQGSDQIDSAEPPPSLPPSASTKIVPSPAQSPSLSHRNQVPADSKTLTSDLGSALPTALTLPLDNVLAKEGVEEGVRNLGKGDKTGGCTNCGVVEGIGDTGVGRVGGELEGGGEGKDVEVQMVGREFQRDGKERERPGQRSLLRMRKREVMVGASLGEVEENLDS